MVSRMIIGGSADGAMSICLCCGRLPMVCPHGGGLGELVDVGARAPGPERKPLTPRSR